MRVCTVVTKTQRFRLLFIKCLAGLENDTDSNFPGNLENGATVGYMSDLGKYQNVMPGKTKRRVYDAQRKFLGNYKTAIGKEETLPTVIVEDFDDGLVSGTFPESELRSKYLKVR